MPNPSTFSLTSVSLFLAMLLIAAPLSARKWHVNAETGSDSNSGVAEKPFKSLQKGINSAKDGDVIQLHPQGAVIRQSGRFGDRSGITIEGNGVTLDGADPLPVDGWEKVGANLYRRQLKRTPLDRHLLIVDGVMQRMGRTQSAGSPEFPAPAELEPGEFCFENIDKQTGWLYVCGSIKNLEWSTRVNGIGMGGVCRRIVVQNLETRNFLNDGFNIHGDGRELTFENIHGYDCFDEGFSAHETSECLITGGKFYGNENGIADVNASETVYRNCEFYGNVNTDVLLIGKAHALIDCKILNSTSAAALVAGPRTKNQSFALQLQRVTITTQQKSDRGLVRMNGGTLLVENCVCENIGLNTLGADVTYQGRNLVDGAALDK
ncbi:right-handed parallel beta-helix repeat-containing protein [Blastopirellula sp. J2-11]|uniref:right-handed parallel beta-helix repeat-containing protein n=1 Tax=Blastopirellula sp. J2-11 TaxID=2943192 RepID=UPI0021C89A70|nr:right-handed parallel beta-helix repeat-containing protein [Blastopirellula sp. J2-11]UUO05354.1 right-handed parallel beta-helix repeat-containing protein [Blastopirellula sp. J2-11]